MKNNFTLVIMAAGLGSRFGGNKQLEGMGPNGELLMEYSIYDAIETGFTKLVLIVRPDIREQAEKLVSKFRNRIEIAFVNQTLDTYVPDPLRNPLRRKPYGTGHALLCAKAEVDGPFCIINADDFYSRLPFKKVIDFFNNSNDREYGLVTYTLSNVLSSFGGVSRGICELDEEGYLLQINEINNIIWENQEIYSLEDGFKHPIASDELVSMNFWGFKPSIFDVAEKIFNNFLKLSFDRLDNEFYIIHLISYLINQDKIKVKVIPAQGKWLGVTYKEDKPSVVKLLNELVSSKQYPYQL
jgi:NDP-sugar pyrophosphorylase family protein